LQGEELVVIGEDKDEYINVQARRQAADQDRLVTKR